MSRLPKVLIKKILLTSIGKNPKVSDIRAIRLYCRWLYNDVELKYILNIHMFNTLEKCINRCKIINIYFQQDNLSNSLVYIVRTSNFNTNVLYFRDIGSKYFNAELKLHDNTLTLSWDIGKENTSVKTYNVCYIVYPNILNSTNKLDPSSKQSWVQFCVE